MGTQGDDRGNVTVIDHSVQTVGTEQINFFGAGFHRKEIRLALGFDSHGFFQHMVAVGWDRAARIVGLEIIGQGVIIGQLFERDYLIAQINRFGGNISKTAAFVGMERSALHRKLKSLNVTTSNTGGARVAQVVSEED